MRLLNDGGVNGGVKNNDGGVNGGVNLEELIFEYIAQHPGIKAPAIAEGVQKSLQIFCQPMTTPKKIHKTHPLSQIFFVHLQVNIFTKNINSRSEATSSASCASCASTKKNTFLS